MTASAADPSRIFGAAAEVLRGNDTGTATKAAPHLYPHQWSWDAAFVAIGWAAIDVGRAMVEIDSLLGGQWSDGMIPHIVFDPQETTYVPGPELWAPLGTRASAKATSGLCQPPVHALALSSIAAGAGPEAREWIGRTYDALLRWHRYLAKHRVDRSSGLVTIFHPWESGLDNSPRWDAPMARVAPTALSLARSDLAAVDAGERPTNEDYARYLALVTEMRAAGYDATILRRSGSFLVGDVFFTALYAVAGDVLAELGDRIGLPAVDELRRYARDARSAVAAHQDAATGMAYDVDLRRGDPLRTGTVAGFAPLLAGAGSDDLLDRLVEELLGPRWAGYPGLRWPVPPSVSPDHPAFSARAYWRGPSWPVINWLLVWSLDRCGHHAAAVELRAAALEQVAEGSFAEYYEPFTGEPLGSPRQSWTAAVTLDWLT
jgi:hypothetical protein